jgi:sodium/hydrogen antiporter
MLLNISVFMWYGAVCPWASFRVNNVIPIWRLILLGILILLLRRVPFVMAIHKKIPQIEEVHQAAFMGFFGPIGVSAIFYLYVSLDFLNAVTDKNSDVRPDAQRLKEIMYIVVWFLAICSIVVHGLSVPMGKLGYHLPRQISQALSTSQEVDEPYEISRLRRFTQNQSQQLRQRRDPNTRPEASAFSLGPPRARKQSNVLGPDSSKDEPERPIHYPETPIDGARTPNGALTRSQSPPVRAYGELLPAEPPRAPSAARQKEL